VAWFRREGSAAKVQITSDGDFASFPELCPVLEDARVKRLRAKYAGKKVWSYGGGVAAALLKDPEDALSVHDSVVAPFVIKRLLRIAKPGVMLHVGPRSVLGGDLQADFTTNTPLVALLDVPGKPHVAGGEFSGKDEKEVVKAMTEPEVIGYYRMFDGAWDFEREYSLASPFKTHPEWSASVRKAVREGEVRKGMTHDMVAWAIGWPSERGSIAEMKTWKAWRYDRLPPFSYWVYFQNGKVVRFGEDGHLP
jgi:hypothetical protein